MEMKNKLNKHHKNRFAVILSKSAFFFGFFVFAGAAITLPTYISINATEVTATKIEEKKTEIESQNIEEEDLLTIVE